MELKLNGVKFKTKSGKAPANFRVTEETRGLIDRVNELMREIEGCPISYDSTLNFLAQGAVKELEKILKNKKK